MDKKEIEKKVIGILADRLDLKPDKIKPESKLVEDLGLDSFGAVEVMFEIEDKFGIRIKDEDLRKIQTVKDIIQYIIKSASGASDKR